MMAYSPVDRESWVTSSSNLGATMVSLFESGDLYDCTFKVGFEGTEEGFKNFKCHKLILCVASVVFETMFSGNFKEAHAQRDEPIWLKEVSSETFDCAMRFVYGREKKFKDTELAVQVFKFAHEMQIQLLEQEVEKFIIDNLSTASVFAAFNLFKFFAKQTGLQQCKDKILKLKTKAALGSKCWLQMSQDSVLDFLQMDFLEVKETDLIRALIKWGQAQVNQDDDEEDDNLAKLRSKILPCLQFINLRVLSHMDFACLCLDELGQVLNGDQKHAVMMCITLGKWNLLPNEIAPANQISRLRSTSIVVPHYSLSPKQCNYTFDGVQVDISLNRRAKLIGFMLIPLPSVPAIKEAFQSFKITLRGVFDKSFIGTGSSKVKLIHQGRKYFKVSCTRHLLAGFNYRFSINLPKTFEYYCAPFILDSASAVNCEANGQLTLSLHNKDQGDVCAAKITELLFELF